MMGQRMKFWKDKKSKNKNNQGKTDMKKKKGLIDQKDNTSTIVEAKATKDQEIRNITKIEKDLLQTRMSVERKRRRKRKTSKGKETMKRNIEKDQRRGQDLEIVKGGKNLNRLKNKNSLNKFKRVRFTEAR